MNLVTYPCDNPLCSCQIDHETKKFKCMNSKKDNGRAVVSFANNPFYQEKMKRLQQSVESQGVKFIGYTSFEQVGCKPHSEVPYQFKPYAIKKAISEGVTTLLWCDSPLVAIKDLSHIFDHIERFGYVFFNNYGHPLGKWTNDKCLNWFDITRDQSMNIKQIMACCMGFGLKRYFADKFIYNILTTYQLTSDSLYPGSWDNHRHDQSVMSCLIHNSGLEILDGHKSYFIYEHFKQVPEFQPIAESVCLISR